VLEGHLALKAIFARFQAQCPANLDKFGFFYEYLKLFGWDLKAERRV
jgi:hypothetical protein